MKHSPPTRPESIGSPGQEILCLGLSHHQVGVEVRERFAFPEGRVPSALGSLRGSGLVSEAVILSTCNRVEIYAVAKRRQDALDALQGFLSQHAGVSDLRQEWLYELPYPHSASHLFRVASGLDSMMLGETEILGQVKRAYQLALENQATGKVLNRLFQKAFQTAKQVRTETGVTRGAVSVGSAAVELAQGIFGDLHEQRAMILGAGEISERTARSLISRGVKKLIVSNRSSDRAEQLAGELGGEAIPFEAWPSRIVDCDILISSTAAPHTVVHPAQIREAMKHRRDRPLFVIDLAVPRDVEPAVNEIANVYLYDIDALEGLAQRAADERGREIKAAEALIHQHQHDFALWWLRQTRPAPCLDLIARAQPKASRAA